jgi:ABC-type metal ion transport system substrate-binding protein
MSTKTTTRKHLITDKYNLIITKIQKVLAIEQLSLPIIDKDIDFIDLVFLFNHYFVGATEDNYKQMIDEFVAQNQKYQNVLVITAEQKEQLYPVFKEFIFWFKSLT